MKYQKNFLRKSISRANNLLFAVLAGTLLIATPASAATATQSMAIPAYEYPTLTNLWPSIDAGGSQIPFVVVNPASGPGPSTNPDYTTRIATNTANGTRSIGYVDTTFQARPIADVLDDIDQWNVLYPGVTGILLDQVSVSNAADLCYTGYIYNYIKARHPSWLVVDNFGTYASPAYEPYGDIFLNAEMDHTLYQTWVAPTDGFQDNAANSNRFWHLVHTTIPANYPATLTQTRNNNAGWVYITDDTMPNPYDAAASYFSTELTDIATLPPTTIPNRGATALPAGCVDVTGNTTSAAQAKSIDTTNTLTNTSSTYMAPGQNKITFTLPSGVTLASASGTGWTCTGNECVHGDIAPGATTAVLGATFNVSCDYQSGVITVNRNVFSASTSSSTVGVTRPTDCPAGGVGLADTGADTHDILLLGSTLVLVPIALIGWRRWSRKTSFVA